MSTLKLCARALEQKAAIAATGSRNRWITKSPPRPGCHVFARVATSRAACSDVLPERSRTRTHFGLLSLDVEDLEHVELLAATRNAEQLAQRRRRLSALAVDRFLDVRAVFRADPDAHFVRTIDRRERAILDPALARLVRAAMRDALGSLLRDVDAPSEQALELRGRNRRVELDQRLVFLGVRRLFQRS